MGVVRGRCPGNFCVCKERKLRINQQEQKKIQVRQGDLTETVIEDGWIL